MRILPSSVFLLYFIFTPSTIAISIHSHSHSHSQERVEDGAFSPKVHDPKAKKSESELIHEVMLGKCFFHVWSSTYWFLYRQNSHKSLQYDYLCSLFEGSAKEAEKFDHLPPEESKKRLLLLLSKIDVDNNKFVDAKELFEWIVKSFK